MTQFYVYFNPEAKEIHALLTDSAPDEGATRVGEFTHNGDDPLGYVDNHVAFQHIRDIFYKLDSEGNTSFFPDNITDFTYYKIFVDKLVLPMRIKVVSDEVTVVKGATVDLEMSVLPADALNKDVTISSSNETIATVTSEGVVTGEEEGEVEITITSDAVDTLQKTVSVSVVELVLPTQIDVTPATVTVAVLGSEDLEVTVLPEDTTDKSVTYESADEGIATVSNTGTVVGVAQGETVITITSVAEGAVQKTVSVTVTSE